MWNVSSKNKICLTSLGTILFNTSLITLGLILLSSANVFAGTSMPSNFTYQGRLMNSAGNAPLAANTTVYFEIRNPSGACLLYSEHQNVNTTTTAGLFSVRIGDGTRTNAVAGYQDDPGYDFSEIFTNKQAFPTVAGACPGGWTPGATDARILRVHVWDGATTTTLADQTLSPVPQASVADTIDGVPLQGLTLNWTDTTPPANPVANVTHGFNRDQNRFEKWNGATWVPTTPKFASTAIGDPNVDGVVMKWNNTSKEWEPGVVDNLLPTLGGDITGPDLTDVDVVGLQGRPIANTAPNPNQVLKWNGAAWAPADDGGVVDGTVDGQILRWDGSAWAVATGVSVDGSGYITLPGVPTAPDHAATKDYVDTALSGVDGLPAMTDAEIVVSNGTTPTAVAMSGDATIANTGSVSVVGLRGQPVSNTAPTTTDQALMWNGAAWAPATVSSAIGTGTQNYIPKWNNAGGTTFGNSNIQDSGTAVTIGVPTSINGPLVLQEIAAPTATAGYSKIYPKTDNNLYYLDEAGNESQFVFGTGAGEVNTGSSLGGTADVFKQKTGVDLEFRGITGSTNITVTENANDITIAATGLQTSLTAGTNTAHYLKWDGDSWEPAFVSSLAAADGTPAAALSVDNDGIVSVSGSHTVTNGTDVAHKTYVDTALALLLPDATDGTLTGDILRWDGDSWEPMTLGDGTIMMGNATGAVAVTMLGDARITNAGVLTIENDAVTTAKIDDGAVTLDKLSPGTQNGQIVFWDSTNTQWTTVNTAGIATGNILKWDATCNSNAGCWELDVDAGAAGTVTSIEGAAGTVDLLNGSTGNAPNWTQSGSDVTLHIPLASSGASVTSGTISNAEYLRIPASGTGTNNTLRWDGTAWVETTGLTIEADGDVVLANAPTVGTHAATKAYVDTAVGNLSPVTDGGSVGQTLRWDGDSWEPMTLADGTIMMGNATGAVAVTMSNDVTLTNAGVATVAGIRGRTVENTAPTRAGQMYMWDLANTRWDLTDGTSAPTNGQVLTWDNALGKWKPADAAAGGAAIASGSGTTNRLIMFNASDELTDSAFEYMNDSYGDTVQWLNFIGTEPGIAFNGSRVLHQSGETGNISVGDAAGFSFGTGDYNNTAIGASAMNQSNDVDDNTAVGMRSLYNAGSGATQARGNTAMGSGSLGNLTSGDYNTAVGGQATDETLGSILERVTTGSSNTAIGFSAGNKADTSSSGNVFIGAQAGPTVTAVVSNKLYIDNSENNTPLLYGDFADNYLRINNILEMPTIATPADPAASHGRVYFKADGLYYKMGSTESKLSTATGGITSLGGLTDGVQTLAVGTTGNSPGWVSATGQHTLNIPLASASGTVTSGTISNAEYLRIPASGTGTNNTLRWDGTGWVETTGLTIEADGDVVLANAPTVGTHAATKAYVDTAVADLSPVADGGSVGQTLRWDGDSWEPMTLADGTMMMGNATGAAAVTMSGDATISNTGVLTIAANAVTTGKIANATILFEDVATNGCTADQVMGRNAGNNAWECKTPASGGTTISGGTQDYLPKFNAAGTNIVNSAVIDNGTSGVNLVNRKLQMGGDLVMQSTSSANVTVGHYAGGGWTGTGSPGGSNNVLLGFEAGQLNSTNANYNVAVGNAAMKLNTGGVRNTAVGAFAVENATGSNNVGVGSGALNRVAAGDSNVALGTNAGEYANAASTGNLFLGHGAGPTAAGAVSNKLYIDNSANNTPLIYGDFSTDTLTVNGDLVLSMTGKYFNYKPNATECNDGQVMVWVAATDRWICADAPAPANVDIDTATPFETSVGYNAGAAVAAGGLNNSFFGYAAGDVVSTGDDNVGIGYNAMGATTTGYNNVVIGSGAAAAMTTSRDNIIIGKGAMPVMVDGTGGNIALGTNTLFKLNDTTTTNDRYNIAIGLEAMQGVERGSQNVAIGQSALGGGYGTYYMSNSTAVGVNALKESNPGQYAGNDAFGHGALEVLAGNASGTQGVDNVAIGYRSLYTATTGNYNVALGRNAGANANAASSSNIFIGNAAGPTAAGAISNKLYIHNDVSNTPLIYGDFSTGSLTINGAGGVTATAYYYSSDRNLKENISTMESPLEKILKLRAVTFDWKESGNHDVGFIAQEVEEVFPELVGQNEQGVKSVKYGNIVSPLVGAVQELHNMSVMSEQQIAAIDSRLANAERKIASLEEQTAQQQKEIDLLKEQVQFLMKELKK